MARVVAASVLCLETLGAAAESVIRVGASPSADAPSISAGLALVPDKQTERWTVLVEPGFYRERVWVRPELGPVTMQGVGSAEQTVLIFHCCPGGNGQPGCANSTVDPACAPQHAGAGIRGVETLLVEASDFIMLNMTVANDACGYDHHVAAQTETVQLLADRSYFQHVRFLGAQDTIYSGNGGVRQYIADSYINGSVDSIYGLSSMVIERCEVAITSYVTAHRGSYLSDGSKSVYLFLDSQLTKPKPGDQAHPAAEGATDLGRPWGGLATVIYKNTFMDDHISARGWNDWGHSCESDGCSHDQTCWCQNVTFAEFQSHGPGASDAHIAARAGWSQQLSTEEAEKYTRETVLRGWNPAVLMAQSVVLV